MKKTTLAAAALAASLAFPAAAAAHVTVQPDTVPAGGFVRLDVRVPNEMDNADTTKLQLRLPNGFAEASYEPNPGWTVQVKKTKLAEPIKTDDGEVTEQVSEITWTGHGPEGRIPPGAFKDFGLSVQVPGKPGDKLTFKALQTYSNGKIVRWIGPEGTDSPAPVVNVTSASSSPAPAASATPAPAPAKSASSSSSGSSDALSIVALIVGALGLLTGAMALAGSRRRSTLRAG
jgi:periplasmic copper chaperone A